MTSETAFEAYERLRVPRANAVVDQSFSFGRLGQLENRAGIWLRNTLMRLTPKNLQLGQVRKLMHFEAWV